MPPSVGRFHVLGAIGAGSAGVVVAAYDPVLDRKIALKLLHAGESGDAQLLREAQAMARLAHPNAVAIHEAGAADGRVYLAMEFVDGGTLRAWLEVSPRNWREVRDRFVEAGRGLAAAHDAGLVHRDFKPDNVLVGRDGCARVTDFGLVRALASAPGDGEPAAPAGTPRYMAPEQHRGRPAGPSADQFAFCVALYEALWRADPFAAPTPEARRARVVAGDVDPPPPGRVPARLASAVLRGLAADPAGRYPTMRALLDDIARDPTADRRRRLRLIAVGLAGAGLATAVNSALPRATEVDAPAPAAIAGEPDPHRFRLGIAVAWGALPGGALFADARPDGAGPADARPALAFHAASLDSIARAGATSTNLLFEWPNIEPAQGIRDWSETDRQVAEVEKRGLEPFAHAVGSPRWVGRDANTACADPRRAPPPRTRAGLAAFRDFFSTLSRRYCGRVKYYEFWSEANGCSWMSCGCGDQTPAEEENYAFWLDQWYQAMREGCSDVLLAIGGLDCRWGPDPDRPATGCADFLDRIFQNRFGDSFDAVALHPHGARDPEVALRENEALNWAAIRRVTEVLRRRGAGDRMLWISGWGFDTADERTQARLLDAALTGLRGIDNVFEAQYAAVTDQPGGAAGSRGLVALTGPIGAPLQPRAAWFAFRDQALGPGAAWHGPVNPGLEFQGQPPSLQFTTPIPFWGPNGAWQSHALFRRPGNGVLGRKAGYYAAGTAERFAQTLTDSFEPGRRYCFASAAHGGRDDVGVLPYQIGYLDEGGREVVLRTRTAQVGARWRETAGVCHDVAAAAPEVGRRIVVGFGSGQDGGASDVWFDNLRVVSTPL